MDMTKRFPAMCRFSQKVPHGFATAKLDLGPLNAYGHESVARALAHTIRELEEAGKLCK